MSRKQNYQDHRSSTHIDNRNYNSEAVDLLKEVSGNQLYALYQIVVDKLKNHSQSEEKQKELEAVKNAIEKTPQVDISRLTKIVKGYNSSMAEDARTKDGYTRPHRKKV